MYPNHTLGFLKEIVENPLQNEEEVSSARMALGFGNPGKNMELYEYSLLVNVPSAEGFNYLCGKIVEKYEKIWNLLGKPENAHEWYNRMWNKSCDGYVKTRKRHIVMKEMFSNPPMEEMYDETGVHFEYFTYTWKDAQESDYAFENRRAYEKYFNVIIMEDALPEDAHETD